MKRRRIKGFASKGRGKSRVGWDLGQHEEDSLIF